ncbi:MAG TPA: hypothetical protein VL974_13090 [Magnetospirillum sp.]|jgi:hypothetical protein|nr:hypothetical protein [Magnetospirillum sp.]
MSKAAGTGHDNVVRKINATLQGPVIDALSELVPEIRRLPRRNALEAVLDDIDLLHRCFLTFRTNPERFRHLLVNKHKVSVEDAEALLECGRSLDQVIAMVVRTAAKRHFRKRLDGTTKSLRARPIRRAKRRDLLSRLRDLLMPQPSAPSLRGHGPRVKSRAEALYEAFQDYLLHDWQVPMIPEYCLLSPGIVRRLGPRILDYRIAEDIRRLRADPDNPPPPTPLVEPDQQARTGLALPQFLTGEPNTPKEGTPVPITVAEKRVSDGMAKIDYGPADTTARDERARLDDILTADGKRLKANAFTLVLLDPKVRTAIPDSEQTVRITGILGSVNGMAGKMLVGELGLRVDQLAVFLMTAHAALGEQRFETAFGIPGRPDYVARIVERAKAYEIGQQTPLADIAAFVTKSFKAK